MAMYKNFSKNRISNYRHVPHLVLGKTSHCCSCVQPFLFVNTCNGFLLELLDLSPIYKSLAVNISFIELPADTFAETVYTPGTDWNHHLMLISSYYKNKESTSDFKAWLTSAGASLEKEAQLPLHTEVLCRNRTRQRRAVFILEFCGKLIVVVYQKKVNCY